MKVKLTKLFRFEASHCLDQLPKDHVCNRMHGHSYRVKVEVSGEVDPKTGFLIDYSDMKEIVQPIIDQLDHGHLNDIDGLNITSTEYLAAWLWNKIKPKLDQLSKLTIYETDSTSCEYTGQPA